MRPTRVLMKGDQIDCSGALAECSAGRSRRTRRVNVGCGAICGLAGLGFRNADSY